jgi:hypothetical protein
MGLLFRSKLKNPFDDKEFIFLRIQLAFIPKQFFSGSDHSPDKIVHWQNTPNISNISSLIHDLDYASREKRFIPKVRRGGSVPPPPSCGRGSDG